MASATLTVVTGACGVVSLSISGSFHGAFARPHSLKGTHPVKLRTAFVGVSTLALTALPLSVASAGAIRPAGSCGYYTSVLEDDSTAITVAISPACAGEAAATPTMWEYVPISKGDTYVYYSLIDIPTNIVIITMNCTGTAPNVYQVIYSSGGPFAELNISDNCGPFTEP